MTAERNYAQIEKECLAAFWACEKFNRYITGLDKFQLLTDHKPLVLLLLINTQYLNNTHLRCKKLLMRLGRYNPIMEHVPKLLIVPDTLSHSPLSDLVKDTELYVNSIVKTRS